MTMPTYDVTCGVQVNCTVVVRVCAASKEAAIEAAQESLPGNVVDDRTSSGWRAKVTLKTPVQLMRCRADSVQGCGGFETARRVAGEEVA